jgi:hypothetical protein
MFMSFSRNWFTRALQRPAASWIGVALGLLFALPSLGSGFFADDYWMLNALDKVEQDAPPWYDLYRFVDRPRLGLGGAGGVPWWSAPDLRFHLVRPLTSALFALDHRWFGHSPLGFHLHSLLWFAAFLVLARRFYRQVLERETAAIATWLTGTAPFLTMPPRWLASRHLLVAAVPIFAGLSWLAPRDDRPRRGLAAAAFIIALGAGEAGLGGLALWAAYEWLGPGEEPVGKRTRKALAPVMVGIAYLVAYRMAGGGMQGGGVYVDPLANPWGFAHALVTRLPLLLGNAFWLFPAEIGVMWTTLGIAVGIAGTSVILFLMLRISSRVPERDRSTLRWLIPGALLAAAGTTAGIPGGRELTVAAIGTTALVATVLRYGWIHAASGTFARCAQYTVVALLATTHVAVAPLLTLATDLGMREAARAEEQVAHEMLALAGDHRRLVVLAVSDPLVWMHAPMMALSKGPDPNRCWWTVSGARASHRVVRTGPSTLSFEVLGTSLLLGPFEQLFRTPELTFAVGDVVEHCGVTIQIAAVQNGHPVRLNLDFLVPLEDSHLVLARWREGKIERVKPEELAKPMLLEWSRGPMEML